VARDRDEYVPKHKTPPAGVPDFVTEECTGRYEGEELARRRAHRKTDERVARLEEKYDKLVHSVLDKQERTERRQLDSRTKIIIAVIGAISAALGYLLGGCV